MTDNKSSPAPNNTAIPSASVSGITINTTLPTSTASPSLEGYVQPTSVEFETPKTRKYDRRSPRAPKKTRFNYQYDQEYESDDASLIMMGQMKMNEEIAKRDKKIAYLEGQLDVFMHQIENLTRQLENSKLKEFEKNQDRQMEQGVSESLKLENTNLREQVRSTQRLLAEANANYASELGAHEATKKQMTQMETSYLLKEERSKTQTQVAIAEVKRETQRPQPLPVSRRLDFDSSDRKDNAPKQAIPASDPRDEMLARALSQSLTKTQYDTYRSKSGNYVTGNW